MSARWSLGGMAYPIHHWILGAICIVALPSCATTEPNVAARSSVTSDVKPRLALPIDSPLDQVERNAKAVLGSDFAGVSLVDGKIMVYSSRAIPDPLPKELQGAVLKHVSYSMDELQMFKADVSPIFERLIKQGIQINTWGVDVDNNTIFVSVVGDPGPVKTAMRSEAKDVPFNIETDVEAVQTDALYTS